MSIHNNTGKAVSTTWLVLERKLTVDLIAKPKMVVNIWTVRDKEAIRVHCNSEKKLVNQFGKLPGYGTVWYEPTGITNILYMSRVTRKYQVVSV